MNICLSALSVDAAVDLFAPSSHRVFKREILGIISSYLRLLELLSLVRSREIVFPAGINSHMAYGSEHSLAFVA